jgi:hypothetical protein
LAIMYLFFMSVLLVWGLACSCFSGSSRSSIRTWGRRRSKKKRKFHFPCAFVYCLNLVQCICYL